MKEIEGLPLDLQEGILKLVHFIKEEFFINKKSEPERKKINALLEVDKIALETGISDLASQHDHYLYGIPKE
jgi:hypothetical protein